MPAGVAMVIAAIAGIGAYIGLYFSPRNNFLEGLMVGAVIVFGLALVRLLIAAVRSR
jgi:hypothetical protein